ncbi:MAG: zinc-ribbon domain-containing protein [Eubacterium sp.]|nr:zinc-ribbon domain-containing protein [Eubacterium sp.]
MFCNKCGTENEEGAKFCRVCGNSLKVDDLTAQTETAQTEVVQTETAQPEVVTPSQTEPDNEPGANQTGSYQDVTSSQTGSYQEVPPNQNGSYQMPPNQGGYQAYNSQQQRKQVNSYCVASMILGIVSIVCCCSAYIGVVAGVLAIVFAVKEKNQGNEDSYSKAGLVCGIIGCSLSVITCILSIANAFSSSEFLHYMENYSNY